MEDVLEHLKQPFAFIDEAARVLMPGGILFVQTWVIDRSSSVADTFLMRDLVPSASTIGFQPHVGIVVGRLRDALIGQTVGVKLFRTECFTHISFQDTIAPDRSFADDIAWAGWSTLYIGKLGSSWATVGEHRPDYTPVYTYRKYFGREVVTAWSRLKGRRVFCSRDRLRGRGGRTRTRKCVCEP